MTIVVASILLAAALAAGILSLRYLRPSAQEPAIARNQVRCTPSRFQNARVLQGVKIILVSWQIISQVISDTHEGTFSRAWLVSVVLSARFFVKIRCG